MYIHKNKKRRKNTKTQIPTLDFLDSMSGKMKMMKNRKETEWMVSRGNSN